MARTPKQCNYHYWRDHLHLSHCILLQIPFLNQGLLQLKFWQSLSHLLFFQQILCKKSCTECKNSMPYGYYRSKHVRNRWMYFTEKVVSKDRPAQSPEPAAEKPHFPRKIYWHIKEREQCKKYGKAPIQRRQRSRIEHSSSNAACGNGGFVFF